MCWLGFLGQPLTPSALRLPTAHVLSVSALRLSLRAANSVALGVTLHGPLGTHDLHFVTNRCFHSAFQRHPNVSHHVVTDILCGTVAVPVDALAPVLTQLTIWCVA